MKIILLIIGLLVNHVLLMDQFSITTYNAANAGLPSNYISCVEIDEENIVWLRGTDFEEGEGGIFGFLPGEAELL